MHSILVLVAWLGLVLLPAPVFAQVTPTLTVTPNSAAPGEKVTVSGSGWPANVTVVAHFFQARATNGPSADLAVATSDASGAFSTQGTVPPTLFGPGSRANLNVIPGSYTIVAASGPGVSAPAVAFTVGPPRQGALLWGTAFFDVNGDGRLDDGDVPGAVGVTIRNTSQAGPTVQAFADVNGHYVVSPVAPGTYTFSVQSQFQSATWSGSATASAGNGQAVEVDLPLHRAVGLPRTGGVPGSPISALLVGGVAVATGLFLRRFINRCWKASKNRTAEAQRFEWPAFPS